MNRVLTLSVYEYPAALYDINEWYARFIDKVESRKEIQFPEMHGFKIVHTMKPLGVWQEIIVSLPSSVFSNVSIDSSIFGKVVEKSCCLENFLEKEFKLTNDLFKSLLHGSFKYNELRNIANFQEYLLHKYDEKNGE